MTILDQMAPDIYMVPFGGRQVTMKVKHGSHTENPYFQAYVTAQILQISFVNT